MNEQFFLIGDIGGTHITLGVSSFSSSNYDIIFKKSYLTKDFDCLSNVVNLFLNEFLGEFKDVLKDFGKFDGVVIGVATKIPENFDMIFHLSNSPFFIDRHKFVEIVGVDVEDVMFINDFESIGWAVTNINSNKLLKIYEGKYDKKEMKVKDINDVVDGCGNRKDDDGGGKVKKSVEKKKRKPNLIVIGAGTGLGKISMRWDSKINKYEDIPSEEGHMDFIAVNEEELRLSNFIRNNQGKEIVEFEDVLSGRGIENIYSFLTRKEELSAKEICFNKDEDLNARKTFELFFRFYARFARIMALKDDCDIVYLAGGIITKNLDFSREDFMKEFLLGSSLLGENLKGDLEKVSVYAINDYDISLDGICEYVLNKK